MERLNKKANTDTKPAILKPGVKRSYSLITLFCFLTVISLSFLQLPIVELIDFKAFDLRFLSRKVQPVHPDVAIAVIDEKSLDAEGRWPWPRSRMARLVDCLSDAGARVVGFDVGFFESEENPVADFIHELDHHLEKLNVIDKDLDQLIFETGKKTDRDQILADAVRQSSSDVVLGYFFHMPDPGNNLQFDEADVLDRINVLSPSKYTKIRFKNSLFEETPFFTALAPEGNLDLLTDATPYSGYFNMAADSDGVVRWLPLIIQCRQDLFPPLSLLAAWLYLGRPDLHINVDEYGVKNLFLGETRIPTDEYGQLLISYPGPSGTFPVYSATDILQGSLKHGIFKDKVVIVGVTATGLNDNRTTPFGPDYPGVEIHAAAVSSILTGQFLTKSQWTLVFDLVAVAFITLIMGFAIPRLNAMAGFGFTAILFTIQVVGSQLVFLKLNIWINVVYPLLGVIITYTLLTLNRYFSETRERRKIKNIFSRYASAELIEEIVKEPEKLKLGGEVKIITVLFCDLANFTNISENRTPNQVVGIMSNYFKEMTDHVYNFKGTLKEYVGDELMALFGAPLYQEEHALNACRTALAMQHHLKQKRKTARESASPLLNARVGVNTGEMLVGNLGSEYRFSYGALGDNVNLGSRLEGLNKIYGTKIIIGEKTHGQVKDHFLVRELGSVRVKGRQAPERVFELIGSQDKKLPEAHAFALKSYAEGYKLYLDQEWLKAIEQFKAGHKARPGDKSFEVMIQRCGMYNRIGAMKNWDGVFVERRK